MDITIVGGWFCNLVADYLSEKVNFSNRCAVRARDADECLPAPLILLRTYQIHSVIGYSGLVSSGAAIVRQDHCSQDQDHRRGSYPGRTFTTSWHSLFHVHRTLNGNMHIKTQGTKTESSFNVMINCLLNIISIIGFHGAALILISDLPPFILVYIMDYNHRDKDLDDQYPCPPVLVRLVSCI